MSFLYVKDDQIECTEDGMLLKEVKTIWNNDKTSKAKTYFHTVCAAVYFLYKPRGVYWNKPLRERIEIVNSDHLKDYTWEDLLKRAGVKEFADKYITLTYTMTERLEEVLRNDIDEFIMSMEKMETVIKKEIPADFEVLCEDNILRKTAIKIKIEVPNIDEKKRMWDFASSLSQNFKKIQEALKIEEEERIREAAIRRLYDRPEQNKLIAEG